jgi:hypothetical protein
MNQQDFFANLIEYSSEGGFSFLIDDCLAAPETPSMAKLALARIAAGAAFGLFGSLAVGYSNALPKQQLITDMKRMHECCDLIGIRLREGNAVVRMGIDADNIANETLVGRFAVIHDHLFDFRKYTATFFAAATGAQVVVAFSQHKRAKDFNDSFADKCKHTAFWKKVHTQPWIADLEGREINRLRAPMEHLIVRDDDKLKAALFRSRI